MKILNRKNVSIHPSEMKDGDIAVILQWGGFNYCGRIVQRYGDNLVALGLPKGQGWTNVNTLTKDCQVSILEPGSQLEV